MFNGETGIIRAQNDNQITISFSQQDACDTCGLKVVCAPEKQAERTLLMPNSGQFFVGQKVQVKELSDLELHLALVQFGIPLLLFLTGLGLGFLLPQSWIQKELMAFLIALSGLGLSFFISRYLIQSITSSISEKYLRIIALPD